MQHPFLVYHLFRIKIRSEDNNFKINFNKMLNFQDLPDELVLKILGYSETKHLITYGQLSKRIRRISHDDTLWETANLNKKIVKTELIEMILSKGCKSLNISDSAIIGSLSSNIKSELRALDLSQSAWAKMRPGPKVYEKSFDFIEVILNSCCSLQDLKMEGLMLTPKMVASICKNGKTLQVLNLNCRSELLYQAVINNGYYTMPEAYVQSIIQCCQELKEVDLAYVDMPQLTEDDLEFLAKNISPNVVKLNLSHQDVQDDHVKILLSRCNKIKILNLESTFVTKNLLKTIRQYLNLTLEELSMSQFGYTSFLELKKMPRLKILNVYANKEDAKIIHNRSKHLPHLMIRTFFCDEFGKILPDLNLIYEELD
jgi:hypothetical protein